LIALAFLVPSQPKQEEDKDLRRELEEIKRLPNDLRKGSEV
jgi:hypothetical protein